MTDLPIIEAPATARDDWPFATRYAARAATRLGYRFRELDDDRGYLFAISKGTATVHFGTGSVSAYPLNSQTALGLCRDKAFCARILESEGIPHIPGELFFVTDAYAQFRGPGRELGDLRAYLASRLPVFLKPNRGSRGDFAEPVGTIDALNDYLARVREKHDQLLVQDIVQGVEYRVLVLNGRAVFQYHKGDFRVHGDGRSNWADVFAAINRDLHGRGLSAIPEGAIAAALEARCLSPTDPSGDGVITLPGRRNLSSGNEALAFTTSPSPALAALACRAAAVLNLSIAGVDIFDVAEGDAPPDLKVLEVNANPSFASLERIGETELAAEIWTEILESIFTRP